MHNCSITSPRLKAGLFAVEGLNSISVTYFFYYVYFLMQEKYGFGAIQNFMLAAGLGLIYAFTAVFSGRFAQQFGYLVSLRLGSAVMMVAFAAQVLVSDLSTALGLMVIGNIGMCFTWPALEALVSEGEPPGRLQRLIGIYNLVWSGTGAFAYFTGGAMIKHWGWNSMFLVPAVIQGIELALVLWIERRAPFQTQTPERTSGDATVVHETVRSKVAPKTFLKMALLANPFAYLAINTVVSVIPTVAGKLNLDTMITGFVCSAWLFARTGAFLVLWLWPKWHYRFRFLIGSFVALALSFVTILLTQSLSVLVGAQLIFGVAVGLIYYSSLFYSMDVGETKGEHGGIHEGAIGAGCCAGPAVAMCGLYFFPGNPASGAYAVTLLLMAGFGGLCWLRYRE